MLRRACLGYSDLQQAPGTLMTNKKPFLTPVDTTFPLDLATLGRQLDAVLSRYRRSCGGEAGTGTEDGGTGAVMCAVMRGKVSEGLSLSDGLCRMVIVAGIPLPPRNDSLVKAQMQRLDRVCREAKRVQAGGWGEAAAGVTGEEWYKAQGYVGVNQAVGRVIRHKGDYGAVLFLDERFVNWDGGTWVGKVEGKGASECLQEVSEGPPKMCLRSDELTNRSNLFVRRSSRGSTPRWR